MWSKAWVDWFCVMFCFIKNETGKVVRGENIGRKAAEVSGRGRI